MEDAIIKVDHVSMRFNLAREKVDSLKEYIIKPLKVSCNMMNSGLLRMSVLK